MRVFLVALLFLAPGLAFAGAVELGLSTSYRKTTVNKTNFSSAESYTGSVGYYFTESTALEGSYTTAYSVAVTDESQTKGYFSIYGLDFILTFGGKDAPFRPYVKIGAAQVYKEIRYQQTGYDPLPPVKSSGLTPSAGVGFRILLTDNFSLKVGVEGWQSPINESGASSGESRDTTYDISAKAGVSWLF